MTQLPYPATKEEADLLKREYRNKSAYRKIEKMYQAYGRNENPMLICGDCEHLLGKRFSKTYYKCLLFGDTGGPSTDWVRKWNACGKWEKRA